MVEAVEVTDDGDDGDDEPLETPPPSGSGESSRHEGGATLAGGQQADSYAPN